MRKLTKGALKLQPGRKRFACAGLGTMAIAQFSWINGLTGLLVGQTLYTTPAEIYRALLRRRRSAR